MKLTNVRVVCKNTFDGALAGKGAEVKLRHTATLESRFQEATKVLELTSGAQAEFQANAKKLAETEMELAEFEAMVAELIPMPAAKGKDKAEGMRAALKSNWLHSTTIADGVRGTRWGALNAVTEWAEWIREEKSDKRTDPGEKRFLSALGQGGTVAGIRDKAVRLLTVK